VIARCGAGVKPMGLKRRRVDTGSAWVDEPLQQQ
jgi:hypothetical protein